MRRVELERVREAQAHADTKEKSERAVRKAEERYAEITNGTQYIKRSDLEADGLSFHSKVALIQKIVVRA